MESNDGIERNRDWWRLLIAFVDPLHIFICCYRVACLFAVRNPANTHHRANALLESFRKDRIETRLCTKTFLYRMVYLPSERESTTIRIVFRVANKLQTPCRFNALSPTQSPIPIMTNPIMTNQIKSNPIKSNQT